MTRNYGLDLLKTICAFLVICIHAPFPDLAGDILTPIARIAVPLFFMITGYYYSHTKERQKEKKQIIKIFKLFASANILYIFWSFVKAFISGESVTAFISNTFSVKSILQFMLFNESPFSGHLWYLGAILYVLVIIFLFEKKWSRQKLYPLIPVLLLMDLALGKYSLLLFGQSVPFVFIRNFICVGLPYFLIGDMLKTRNIRMKPAKSALLSLVFVITTLAERFILGYFNVNATRDHYISTTLLAVSLFLLALHFSGKPNNRIHESLCHTGANLSSGIYILHPIFIVIISKAVEFISRYINLSVVYSYTAPFVVMIVTTVAIWVYKLITNKIKTKKSAK